MGRMKKVGAVVLAAACMFSAAGCSKKKDEKKDNNDTKVTDKAKDDAKAAEDSKETEGGSESASVDNVRIPGKLYFINTDNADIQVMTKLTLSGNQFGSSEFNSKAPSTEGIRSGFALNEWVEFYPEASADNGITVYVLEHREDQASYVTTQYGDQMPGFVTYVKLYHNVEEDPEGTWGSFYLNPDEWKPGYYDFVFTYEGKAFATMLTYFFAEGDLEGKTDAELEKIVKEI